MTAETLTELAGSAACILLGTFVAGAEASVVSLPEARMRAVLDELGETRGGSVRRYLADPTALLTKLLTVRVMCLIAASILAANAVLPGRAPWWELAALTGSITFFYSALAEVSMTVGRARGRALAPIALTVTRPFELLITPIAAPFVLLGRFIQNRISLRHSDESPVTEREVEYLVEEAENTGVLDKKRGEMLQNVLELKDVTAREVMVPRTRMHAIDVNTTIERAMAMITEEGHSRVPVYRGQIDNIVGILHIKDLWRQLENAGPPGEVIAIESIARKPVFMVAESQSALGVLRDMQSRRTHMAIVLDEYGSVVGMVTLEDVLEQLVGDIQDEDDIDEAPLLDHGDGHYTVSAAMPIHDLGEHLHVKFPEGDSYASLGGFLAERAGRVPAVGTVVEWNGWTFTVREGDQRHVTKVEIRRSAPRTTKPPANAQAAE